MFFAETTVTLDMPPTATQDFSFVLLSLGIVQLVQ